MANFDFNQGIRGGRYSILKTFHYPEKVNSLLKRKVTAPIYIRLKPTNRCNNNCFFCVYNPEFSTIHPSSNREDEIPIKKMREIIDDLKEMGVKAVTLSGGGEPLIHPDIEGIIRKLIKNRIRISIITNGLSLEGEVSKLLKNADWVRISLDYHNAELMSKIRNVDKSCFEKVKKNIENFAKLKNKNCDLGVNCVVNHLNYPYLVEIAKFCKNIGIDNLRFSPVWKQDFLEYHTPFKEKAIEQLNEAKKLISPNFSVGSTYERYFDGSTGSNFRNYPRCFYMELVPVIAADQCVYTCHNNAYEPAGKIGSIKNQSFKKMWFSKSTQKFFKKFNHKKVCMHECSNDEKNRILNEFADCYEEGVVEYI
jgi:MoaA/NifB/PqqE/SkfB family radical SAM enzyme